MSQVSMLWVDAPPPRPSVAHASVYPRAPKHDRDPLAKYAELTGLPFAMADLQSGMLTYAPFTDLCPVLPAEVVQAFQENEFPVVAVDQEQGLTWYAVRLPDESPSRRLAAGFIPIDPEHPSEWLCAAAEQAGWSRNELRRWIGSNEHAPASILPRLLGLAEMQVLATSQSHSQAQIQELAGQLDSAYEELSLLHEVARNLRISLDPVELAQMCVHHLHSALSAQGCCVLLAHPNEPLRFVTEGMLPCPEDALVRLLTGSSTHGGRKPVVRNRLDESPLTQEYPDLRNLVAAAIIEGDACVGWIVACNSQSRPEFGTVEGSLLNSIALTLSTHLHNSRLFHEQQDLLVAFVRSLVSSLDAKDSYTRGHSERVALVARRLAEQMCLSQAEQEAVHLSALLHDIGKIGVEDAILGKPGRLTEAEFRKLQLHPVIGHDILSGIRNLQHILPGVRNHHESFDGTGYPDRLAGESIPLMARILAVADAFDAMGSDRPYRGGMPIEQVERILTEGAGKQWDPRVIRAYFAARADIRRLWENCRESAELRML